MIKSWAVSGFKAIGSEQRLELAPLTVLAGVNNSGKSSILQALLILCQSLSSARSSQQLLLDGELFQRGEAGDLLHDDKKQLDLELAVSARIQFAPNQFRDSEVNGRFSFRLGRGDFDLTQLALSLISVDAESQTESLSQAEYAATVVRKRWSGQRGIEPAWLTPDHFKFRLQDQLTGKWMAEGLSLWNLMPERIVERIDAQTEEYQEIIRYLQSPTMARLTGRRIGESLEATALKIARELLSDPELSSVSEIDATQRLALRRLQRNSVPRKIQDILSSLKGIYGWRRRPLPVWLDDSVAAIAGAADSVYHLGPLRIPPQFVYSSLPHPGDLRVGSAGEFTAEQLNRHGGETVRSVHPKTLAEEEVSVRAAVNQWLNFMNVAQSISVYYRPKLGHYVWVFPHQTEKIMDLTSIGVGASQVIPVLVQSLIAPPGSVAIFEQPELHLHPSLQSKLADFFLGMARTGRQYLIETHSEHFINRLRFRIAEESDQEVRSKVRIYFSERSEGSSRFRPVEINDFGGIEDWPTGFFDEAHFEAERILRSALTKRQGRVSDPD